MADQPHYVGPPMGAPGSATATAVTYSQTDSQQTAVERASQQLEAEIQNLSHNLELVTQRLNPVLRPNVLSDPSAMEMRVADSDDDVPHADRIHANRRILASINERLLDVLQRLEV